MGHSRLMIPVRMETEASIEGAYTAQVIDSGSDLYRIFRSRQLEFDDFKPIQSPPLQISSKPHRA